VDRITREEGAVLAEALPSIAQTEVATPLRQDIAFLSVSQSARSPTSQENGIYPLLGGTWRTDPA
jgi:hypothetical protein